MAALLTIWEPVKWLFQVVLIFSSIECLCMLGAEKVPETSETPLSAGWFALYQEWTDHDPGTKSSPPLAFVKIYWNRPCLFVYLLSRTAFMLPESSSWTKTLPPTELKYLLNGPLQKSLLSPVSHGASPNNPSLALPFFLLLSNLSFFCLTFPYYSFSSSTCLNSKASPFSVSTLLACSWSAITCPHSPLFSSVHFSFLSSPASALPSLPICSNLSLVLLPCLSFLLVICASSLGLVVSVNLGWVGWLPFSPFTAAFLWLQHCLMLMLISLLRCSPCGRADISLVRKGSIRITVYLGWLASCPDWSVSNILRIFPTMRSSASSTRQLKI